LSSGTGCRLKRAGVAEPSSKALEALVLDWTALGVRILRRSGYDAQRKVSDPHRGAGFVCKSKAIRTRRWLMTIG